MKKRCLLPVLLVPLLAFAARAEAADVRIGGGVGGEVVESDEGARFEGFTRRVEDDGRKLYVGVGLGDHFGVEGAYYDFGERTCCPEIADDGFASSVDAWSLAAVARLPFGRYELFGKAGILQWEETGDRITVAGPVPFSTDGSDPLFGVGGSVLLLEHVAARVEWEAFDLGDASADTVWLLLEIRF